MLAYHLLCHGQFKQVAMLLEALYCPDDVFLVDVDNAKQPDTSAIERWLVKPNVHLVLDDDIAWGGAGTMRKTLRGAFRLLSLDTNWEYYIVLSGQDLPLQSNDVIKSVLSSRSADAINYIRSHCPPKLQLEDIPISNRRPHSVLWSDRGHTKVYGKPGAIDPQVGWYARTLVDVTELGYKGETHVGVADPLLLKRREEFFDRYRLHGGANWFNLHRSLIEYMEKDPFTYELYDVMRSTFIPDESFFQTYIMNSPFKNKACNDYGRLILRPGPIPRVKVLDMSDWDTIQASNELFARKFDLNSDPNLIKQVLSARCCSA